MVTHGAQQAIAPGRSALSLERGDTVVLEDPTYLGSIDIFAGARRSPGDGRGRSPGDAAWTREAQGHHRALVRAARLPDAHLSQSDRGSHARSPAGEPSPASRRSVRLPILEDNTLADLTLGARPPAPIAAYEPVGSCPDRRLAVEALLGRPAHRAGSALPRPLISRLARRKALGDLGNSVVSQMVAARLLPARRGDPRIPPPADHRTSRG